MTIADVDVVFHIEQCALPSPTPWPASLFKQCLDVGYDAFVAVCDECIVGFCLMSIAANEAHILNFAVLPDYQGHGIGRSLLNQLLTVADRQRVSRLFLEVRPDNQAAISLYKSADFIQVGLRKGYYPSPDGVKDALVFAKEVITQ
jgi:ribosomal-protein-alanine N-acetyltransferase